jgi:oligopeptide transport system ATP-binding protein
MAERLLEAIDLQRHFGVARERLFGPAPTLRAVDGVSVELRKGETLGIVGESGCGKSTLAKLLVGLERPTGGKVLHKGRDVAGMSGRQLRWFRRDVQIVFQDPYSSLNPRMTVGKIVSEPWTVFPDVVPRADRRARLTELLQRVGLSERHAGRYPHQFSGGQRQRIGIARALALAPEIIVYDEPVSALDVSVQAQIINLLSNLQAELGLSYVFISHDLSVIRHVSTRVAVMYLGKVVEYGTADEVYQAPRHPYTRALLSAAPRAGGSGRILLEGDLPSPIDPPSGCRFRTRCWKVQDICAEREPPLEAKDSGDGPEHLAACHFPETAAALQRAKE